MEDRVSSLTTFCFYALSSLDSTVSGQEISFVDFTLTAFEAKGHL